jgi:hypothetical protein
MPLVPDRFLRAVEYKYLPRSVHAALALDLPVMYFFVIRADGACILGQVHDRNRALI